MIDEEIMRLAEPRHRVVTRLQLREELGLTDRQIDARLRSGLLSQIVRGTYLVGSGIPELLQLEVAACANHPGAVLSGPTSTAKWGVRRSPYDQFEVSIPTGSKLWIPRAVIRRSSNLDEQDIVASPDGLRVTGVVRTLFDMADRVDHWALRSMAEDARNKELVTAEEIIDGAARLCGRGRPGSAAFLALARSLDGAQPPVQSEDELVLAEALVAAGLPAPRRQHPVLLPSGRRVFLDLFIEESLVDLELDHSFWHSGLVAVQRDKSRDLELRALGIDPVRLTEQHVRQTLRATVAMISRHHERRLALLGRPTERRSA